MALTVVLQDERGFAVDGVDAVVLAAAAIPVPDDPDFPWAATIDLYGDTTFNRVQVPHLRLEWHRLISRESDTKLAEALKQVDRLLKRCQGGTHLYVKFIGD